MSPKNSNLFPSLAALIIILCCGDLRGQTIPQTNWSLKSVDSQELVGGDGKATNAFDGNSATMWHTKYVNGTDPVPHEIQINLGGVYDVTGFRYLPRQDGGVNGRIGQYEFYVSTDGTTWGTAVATGTFVNSSTEKSVSFTSKTGQFVRLRALTEVNGNPWTSAAEINVLGTASGGGNQSPNGVIDTPSGNVTINVGGTVSFTGTGSDPDNNLPLTYLWNFGTGSGIADATVEDPGTKQFNTAGVYTVTFTVKDSLNSSDLTPATRTITVQAAQPGVISQTNWSLKSVDSQELVGGDGKATNAFDGNSATMWHTKYVNGTDPVPHEIQINLGGVYDVTGFRYLPRQDGGVNGRIGQYQFYVSTDGTTWGTAVATGTFVNSSTEKSVSFTSKTGQFVRLRALTEVNGNPWTSAAEINVLGTASGGGNQSPNGVIDTPSGNVTINVGGTVSFTGTGSDPDNNLPLTYLWNFGTGSGIADATVEDPGTKQFNTAGVYTVTFTVKDSLNSSDLTPATRTITVQAAQPGVISQTNWSLKSVDSQELVGGDGKATNAFDGNSATMWHTDYFVFSPAPPHEIQIDLGGVYNVNEFRYLPRQDGGVNGRIGQYEFYVSTDGTTWGTAVATGTFANSATEKPVSFTSKTGQFVRLRALTEVSGNPWTSAADVKVVGSCIQPSVRLIKPLDRHLQTSTSLIALANACFDPVQNPGWGVRFVLDGGPQNGGSVLEDFTAPFGVTFNNLTQSEHTVDAWVINSSGNDFPGTTTQDQSNPVGVGNFYVALGDSITKGVGDDLPSDDNSLDGRNTAGGYTPILNNLLTAATGRPQFIANHGFGGTLSSYGAQLAPIVVPMYPDAQRYLILYGTNDSNPFMPVPSGLGLQPGDPGYAGTFKDNMQRMINTIKSAGKSVALGKIPIALADCGSCSLYPNPATGQRNITITSYNQVIDQLVSDSANGITVVPPNFYSYFLQHYSTEYADTLHPNGIGYQSMAHMWCQALTGQPCN